MKKSLLLIFTTLSCFSAVHFYNNTNDTIDIKINDRMTGTIRPKDISYAFTINPIQAKTITVSAQNKSGIIDTQKLEPSVIEPDLHYLISKKGDQIRVDSITIPTHKATTHPVALRNTSEKHLEVKVKQKGKNKDMDFTLAPGAHKKLRKLDFITGLQVTAFDAQKNKIAHCHWKPYGPYTNTNAGVVYNIVVKKTKKHRYRTWIKPRAQIK